MTTTLLPISRTARAVAFAASVIATAATLSMNLGLVHTYTSSGAAAAGERADCSSKELHQGEEIVPRVS